MEDGIDRNMSIMANHNRRILPMPFPIYILLLYAIKHILIMKTGTAVNILHNLKTALIR